MPSWQARCFDRYARLVIRRRDWGDVPALTRRARRHFGAPPFVQRLALRGLRHEPVRAASGVSGEWLRAPATTARSAPAGVLLYVHGGGYVACSAAPHRTVTAALARHTGCRVLAAD